LFDAKDSLHEDFPGSAMVGISVGCGLNTEGAGESELGLRGVFWNFESKSRNSHSDMTGKLCHRDIVAVELTRARLVSLGWDRGLGVKPVEFPGIATKVVAVELNRL